MKSIARHDDARARRPSREDPRPASPPAAAVLVELQRSAGNQAIQRMLARTSAAPLSIQRRSPNPVPSLTTGTDVPGGGGTFAEHHLIPHNLLELFWKKAGALVETKALIGASGAFLSAWDQVTIDYLVDTRELDGVALQNEAVQRVLVEMLGTVEDLGSRRVEIVFTPAVHEALKHAGASGNKLAVQVTALRKQWKRAQELGADNAAEEGSAEAPVREPEEEEDLGGAVNLVGPYFEWMPGNLVVGPEGAVRANDPKEKYDVEAATALAPDHRRLIETTHANMRVVVGQQPKSQRLAAAETALENIKAIAQTEKTVPAVKPPGQDGDPEAPFWHKVGDKWVLRGRS